MDDKEIVSLFLARDENAIDMTCRKYRAYLYTVAFNILKSHEDAEECVNDTLAGAWRSIPPNKPEVLSTYLAKIARSLCFKKLRDAGRNKRGVYDALPLSELEDVLCSKTGNPEDELSTEELTKAINGYLASLPPSDRKLFVGRYWYCYSIKQLSTAYGFGESKTKQRLKRLRDGLKKFLDKGGYI